MARNNLLRQRRDEGIRTRYRDLKRKNPKWSWIAIIEEVADEFYLTPSTIGRIVSEGGDDVPCATTIIKYQSAVQSAV